VAVPTGEDQPSPYDARDDARADGGDATRADGGDATRAVAPGHGARGVVGRGARDARAEFALAVETLRGELTASHQREAEAHARADRAEEAVTAERARADTLLDQVQGLLTHLATLEANGKAANDRAWIAVEAAGALREQVARLEQRIEAERTRANRAEANAANERQDFLDAESRARRELDEARGQVEAMREQLVTAGRERQGFINEEARERQKQADLHRKVEVAEIAQAEAETDAAELRRAEVERRARGLLARLRVALWGG
jgi:hypothetical protein